MELVTLTLVFIICYGIYAYMKKRYSYFSDLSLPYVPPVPIFGNMAPVYLCRKHQNDLVKDLYNYDPAKPKYIGVFDFFTPVFLIRDPELAKELIIKNSDSFIDRYQFFENIHDPLFDNNLFTMQGEKWRETRNLLSPAFTPSKMKTMFEPILECVENVMDHISKEAKNPENIISARDIFSRYANDVIASCSYGLKVDSFKNPRNDFYLMAEKGSNFEGVAILKILLARACPLLFKILGVKFSKEEVTRFFTDIVKRSIEMRDEEGIARLDMLQLMMDARGKTSEELQLDLPLMTSQAFIFLLGGLETSSSQMCIMAQELTTNPQVQKRLQNEIDSVLSETKGKPSYDSIIAMPYLDAVLNESLRLHPQIEAIERTCTKEFELPPPFPGGKPVVLKPGMRIWLPTQGVPLDKKYHVDPEKFDPDRYLGKKMTINHVENLGFGIGPRSCIGYRFGSLTVKMIFFHLLAEYSLVPCYETCRDFKYKPGSFRITPKEGYWFTVEPRNMSS